MGTMIWDKGSPVTGTHGIAYQHEIISVTDYKNVKKIWGTSGATREDFEQNKILFLSNDLDYLGKMFLL